MTRTVALYGGSFDPIHNGHLGIARCVADELDCNQVIFLPAGTPPHKQDVRLASPEHRSNMIRLAIQDDPRFRLDDFDLVRSGPSYTLQTVEHFRNHLEPDTHLLWILGADSLADLHLWYRIADLAEACTLVTAARPGWEKPDLAKLQTMLSTKAYDSVVKHILPTPLFDVSSTEIRNRCRADQPIDTLVPEPVADYMHTHKLYR